MQVVCSNRFVWPFIAIVFKRSVSRFCLYYNVMNLMSHRYWLHKTRWMRSCHKREWKHGPLIFCHAINTTGVIIHAPVIASRQRQRDAAPWIVNRDIRSTALVAIHLNWISVQLANQLQFWELGLAPKWKMLLKSIRGLQKCAVKDATQYLDETTQVYRGQT